MSRYMSMVYLLYIRLFSILLTIFIRNRPVTELVILKAHNIKLSFNI